MNVLNPNKKIKYVKKEEYWKTFKAAYRINKAKRYFITTHSFMRS